MQSLLREGRGASRRPATARPGREDGAGCHAPGTPVLTPASGQQIGAVDSASPVSHAHRERLSTATKR